MELYINDKPADITLENEKTVMDFLSGIGEWLEGSGLVLSGLDIDGKSYGSRSLDEAFALPLEGLSSINIKTSGWAELLLEALYTVKNDLSLFASAAEEDRKKYREKWADYSPARFLKENAPLVYTAAQSALAEQPPLHGSAGERPGALMALTVTAEHIREIEEPNKEMAALRIFAEEVAFRLEELPLDMQTGKDAKASKTITEFSSLVEKLFRLIFLFRYFRADIDSIAVKPLDGPETVPLKDAVGEFSATLKEMLAAFENRDTVLVGDLAEYELAPRLRSLVAALGVMEEKSP